MWNHSILHCARTNLVICKGMLKSNEMKLLKGIQFEIRTPGLSHAIISPKLTWLQVQYVGSLGSTGRSKSMPLGFVAAVEAAEAAAAAESLVLHITQTSNLPVLL